MRALTGSFCTGDQSARLPKECGVVTKNTTTKLLVVVR